MNEETPYWTVQRTPESLGFLAGTVHMLKWHDHTANLTLDIGEVEVIEVADNFLLSVKPLAPMDDRECGDLYEAGHRFTAYRSGDHDNPYLTFIPCPQDEDDDVYRRILGDMDEDE